MDHNILDDRMIIRLVPP